jgi:hypothetical protein
MKIVGIALLGLGVYLIYIFGKGLYDFSNEDPTDKGFNSQAIWGALVLIFVAIYLIFK